ncbi:unnamed protein product [Cylicocyclus nassatus]|uniref:Uncharacterized protein n=1 Tax=Cylicocyclus nassatus TaxID=53992 RepID=A0AA36H9H2_CYLNA|nr:unnamed protein product [Cylicocyclus nassatus]
MTGRIVWVVRHAEREDNVNENWETLAAARGLKSDNTMLSERGRQQAKECSKRFQNIKLSNVFASPYDRTIETACIIVKDQGLQVKPEPGLCESLHHCEDPPSFWESDKLRLKYPLVDSDYAPIYPRRHLPKAEFGDQACTPRIRYTITQLTEKYTGDLLFVSHGPPIACIHEVWHNRYFYVGQATISKFVEIEKRKFRLDFSGDCRHLSDRTNLRPY